MSLLQLPRQPDVTWARVAPTGGEGGRKAYIIDASGADARNRMMYRLTLPRGSSESVRGLLRVKSTLNVGNPSFEGFAMRVRGFKQGSTTAVWDSNPDSGGRRRWFSKQVSEWTDAVFIEQVPRDKGIDYVTFEIVVRAQSGQITITHAECRHHYGYVIDCSLPGKSQWLGLGQYSKQIVDSDLIASSDELVRWVRYARTISVDIPQGKSLTGFTSGSIVATATETRVLQQFANGFQDLESRHLKGSSAGLMLKFRIKGTTKYRLVTVSEVECSEKPGSWVSRFSYLNNSVTFRAINDYDQIEILPFVQPSRIDVENNWFDGYNNGGSRLLWLKDLQVEVSVADYLEATQ